MQYTSTVTLVQFLVISMHDLLQQLVVGKAEGLLQQDGQHHAEDEQTLLLRSALLVTDLDRDEPNQRGQQQGHEPKKRPEGEEEGGGFMNERIEKSNVLRWTKKRFQLSRVRFG